jgi:hypothetical protein
MLRAGGHSLLSTSSSPPSYVCPFITVLFGTYVDTYILFYLPVWRCFFATPMDDGAVDVEGMNYYLPIVVVGLTRYRSYLNGPCTCSYIKRGTADWVSPFIKQSRSIYY